MCCQFMASKTCGLDKLVELCIQDPTIVTSDLLGYLRADDDVWRYVAICCLGPVAVETLVLETLRDDRDLQRIDELKASMLDELGWLADLHMTVFDRVAAICDGAFTSWELQDFSMKVELSSCAYVMEHGFAQCDRYPLSLAQGGIIANLKALRCWCP